MASLTSNKIPLLTLVTCMLVFSACGIIGSNDSKSSIITLKQTEFGLGDEVVVTITNDFNHDIYIHRQGMWALQQRIAGEWQTIYTPIADTGPPRFDLFLESGESTTLNLLSVPNGVTLDEPEKYEYRFRFGFFSEPALSFPLAEIHRTSPSFQIVVN
ncbi:MAG: hypothetical protein LAT84_07115 [Balneolia bacterium]|nr:hypothetical protein [Balneolia bacterium]